MKLDLVGFDAEMDNLHTCLHNSAKESTLLSGEKARMVDEVRKLSTELSQLMNEKAKERKRADAYRVYVRAEID